MTCQCAKQKQNVIMTGATGAGKSFVASALAEAACRQGMRALFVCACRASSRTLLVADLMLSRGQVASALCPERSHV